MERLLLYKSAQESWITVIDFPSQATSMSLSIPSWREHWMNSSMGMKKLKAKSSWLVGSKKSLLGSSYSKMVFQTSIPTTRKVWLLQTIQARKSWQTSRPSTGTWLSVRSNSVKRPSCRGLLKNEKKLSGKNLSVRRSYMMSRCKAQTFSMKSKCVRMPFVNKWRKSVSKRKKLRWKANSLILEYQNKMIRRGYKTDKPCLWWENRN